MGNHFRLIDAQTYLGKLVYNVFHFECVTGAGSAADLADIYSGGIIPLMTAFQANAVSHEQVVCLNLDNLSDYVDLVHTPAIPGTSGDNPLPAFVAHAFRLVRSERGHHHGAFRCAGVTEESITGGVVNATVRALCDTLATTLSAPFPGASGATYMIRIHRAANTIKPAYSNAEAFYNPSSVVYVRVSTQNSRK